VVLDGLKQGDEGQVNEDILVLCMIDDVDDLLCEQARIDCVRNGTHTGDGIVELEMPIGVPGQRGNPITLMYTEIAQCIGELFRAAQSIRIGIAMYASLHLPCDDSGIGVEGRCVLQDIRDVQRLLHHDSKHADTPVCCCSRRGTVETVTVKARGQ